MSMLRTVSTLAAAAGLATLVIAGGASAQGTCDWYAKTALKQQQDNERLKCGFKGPEWSANLQDHMKWCGSVAPDVSKAQAQKRDSQLATCAKK